jgi:hypothetical protein
VELQPRRYAAMVSTMTFEQLVATDAEHNGVSGSEAWQPLGDRLLPEDGNDAGDLAETLGRPGAGHLVAADVSTGVTSTGSWSTQQYGLDIECSRAVPARRGCAWATSIS